MNRSPGGGSSPVAPERENERGYQEQLARLRDDGTTLPRARFILAQQEAVGPDTPYNRGCIRATAEYARTPRTERGTR